MLHARCLPSACLCEYQFRSNYSFFSPKSFPIAGSSREKIRQLIIMRSTVQWTENENAFLYPMELTFFCVIEKKVKKSEKEKGPVHPLAFGFGFEKTMARVAHRIGLCINLTKLSHKFRTKSLLSLKDWKFASESFPHDSKRWCCGEEMLKVVAQNFCTKEEKGRFIRPKLGLCFCVIIFVHAVKRLLGIFLSIAKKKNHSKEMRKIWRKRSTGTER